MNAAALRLLLSAAYPVVAHLASARHDAQLAALALLDIVLIVLVVPLVRGRGWAWAVVAGTAGLLWVAQRSALLPVLLVLPPVLFTALVAWWFGRTLRPGSVPLITRIVCAMELARAEDLAPALQRYTRRLTALWAALLAAMALANMLLGLFAVPDGVLARLGHPSVVEVPQVMWSWFANLLNYGIVGLVFVIEYLVRVRLFPDRPYRSLPDFLRRLGALGPAVWRDVLR